jgi:hypothetical protein
MIQPLQEAGENIDREGSEYYGKEVNGGRRWLKNAPNERINARFQRPNVGKTHHWNVPKEQSDLDRSDFRVEKDGGEEGLVGVNSGQVKDEGSEDQEGEGESKGECAVFHGKLPPAGAEKDGPVVSMRGAIPN